MGLAQLPAELTDRVINFYHNDKRTLSNYMFTNSSWLAAAMSRHDWCPVGKPVEIYHP